MRQALDTAGDGFRSRAAKVVDLVSTVAFGKLKASIERRVCRAILCTGLGKPGLEELRTSGKSLNQIAHQKARDDWAMLASDQRIPVAKHSRVKYDMTGLKLTLKFLLSLKHVSMLSWGEKKVRLDTWETVKLPVLTRRLTPKLMWMAYKKWAAGNLRLPGDEPPAEEADALPAGLGRSSFLKVVRAVTGHNEKLLCAVDYVTGTLVNDPMRMLRRIAGDFSAGDTRTKLLLHLDLVKNFLKVQYDEHACKEDDTCDTHSVRFGLALDDAADGAPHRTANCSACNFVPFVLKELLTAINDKADVEEDVKTDATRVVKDCAAKLKLYQGHRVRVAHQQKVLSGLMKEMEDRCIEKKGSDEAMVVIDWKMKWLARYHRETTLQHFAKRGVSWHGACIHYFEYSERKVGEGAQEQVIKEAVRMTVYVDQIMEDGNKQNAVTVAAMVEAMQHHIAKDLPHIKKVTLQSDNAGCYRAKQLPLLLAIINQSSPVKVTRLVHTETQDGKGLIDAHFAIATRHLITYIVTTRDNVATANELAFALTQNGGIPNSFVQLVRVDDARLQRLATGLASIEKSSMGSPAYSRLNDVEFVDIANCAGDPPAGAGAAPAATPPFPLDLISLPASGFSYQLKVRAFSGLPPTDIKFTVFPDTFQEAATAAVLDDDDSAAGDAAGAAAEDVHLPDDGEESDGDDDDDDEADDDDEEAADPDADDDDRGGRGPVLTAAQMERLRRRGLQEGQVRVETDDDDDAEDDADEGQLAAAVQLRGQSRHWIAPVTGMTLVGCNHLAADAILGPRRRNVQRRKFRVTERPLHRPARVDVVAVAVRKTMELIDADSQVNIRNGKVCMAEYSLADNFQVPAEEVRARNWAKRPAHGTTYGATYIGDYREKIAELFNRGVQNSSKKQSPAAMQQLLEMEFPNRYSLPQENELRQEISVLFKQQQQEKKKKPKSTGGSTSTSVTSSAMRTKLSQKYTEFLVGLLDEDSNIKPADAIKRMEDHDGGSFFVVPGGIERNDFVSKLRAKLSNLKTARKKK